MFNVEFWCESSGQCELLPCGDFESLDDAIIGCNDLMATCPEYTYLCVVDDSGRTVWASDWDADDDAE